MDKWLTCWELWGLHLLIQRLLGSFEKLLYIQSIGKLVDTHSPTQIGSPVLNWFLVNSSLLFDKFYILWCEETCRRSRKHSSFQEGHMSLSEPGHAWFRWDAAWQQEKAWIRTVLFYRAVAVKRRRCKLSRSETNAVQFKTIFFRLVVVKRKRCNLKLFFLEASLPESL